jgi:phthiodiolone/phenolphthiodiolone dimycocerosates ketoreductase
MVAETSYRTARVTGADSYWLADHLTSVMPRAVMTPKYNGIARLVPDVDAFLEPWTTLGALAGAADSAGCSSAPASPTPAAGIRP